MPARRGATGHGGARKGAGRKRNVLPAEVGAKLGAPPTDKPLKLARWYSAALSDLLWLYLTTGKYVEMLRETKAAAAMGRVMLCAMRGGEQVPCISRPARRLPSVELARFPLGLPPRVHAGHDGGGEPDPAGDLDTLAYYVARFRGPAGALTGK